MMAKMLTSAMGGAELRVATIAEETGLETSPEIENATDAQGLPAMSDGAGRLPETVTVTMTTTKEANRGGGVHATMIDIVREVHTAAEHETMTTTTTETEVANK